MFNNFFDGFISYGRADSKGFATKLQTDLSGAGFNIWFDQNDIPLGVDFQNQIDDGIEKAHNFLYIIAPHSVNSPYCLKEVELALKRNKPIIPLLHVESITYETWLGRNPGGTDQDWAAYQAAGRHSSFPNMHPNIGKINWIYFREGLDDYQQSLEGLIKLMHHQEDYIHQHTELLAKALDWERNHRQNRLLLIGDERKAAHQWLTYRFTEEQAPCEPTDLHCEYICESEKNANNQLTDVFLSYSEQDKVVMEAIARRLMREGKTLWTNKTDIKAGTAFQQEINHGIERADTVVFLISEDSLNSVYCQQELDYTTALNKRVISLLVAPTEVEKIPQKWRSLQFIDITNPEEVEEYEDGLTRLIKSLQEDSVYHYQHKAILVQALKWQEQDGNNSILYRGYNLKNAEDWLTIAKNHPQYPALPLHIEFLKASAAQPPDQSLDVFIAYSRADLDFARKLNEALQLQGKTAWFDQESIASGADFQQEIYKGIEQCDNFLFIISPDAIDSPYCDDEVEFAAKLNKRFVTVLHRPVPEEKLHPAFANLQWIDFRKHDGDFTANFSDLVRTIDLDRDHVKSHTKWLQRSLDWEGKGKTQDMLLRGNEFSIAQDWLQTGIADSKHPPATDLQQEFITKSQAAIEAAIRREKRTKKILQILLAMAMVATGFAGICWHLAVREKRKAQVSELEAMNSTTQALFSDNDQLGALIKAIEAGETFKKLNPDNAVLKQRVAEGLRQTLYGSRIINKLSAQPDVDVLDHHDDRELYGHHAPVLGVAYSPDGNYIASASADNTVKVWRADGKFLKTIPAANNSILAIAFNPNQTGEQQQFATAGVEPEIKLWETGSLEQVAGFSINNPSDAKTITALAYSPDGKLLVSASNDKTAQLWDLTAGDNQNPIIFGGEGGHQGRVTAVTIMKVPFPDLLPQNLLVVTGSEDTTIKLWDIEGNLLNTLEGHTNKVNSVAFRPHVNTHDNPSNPSLQLVSVSDDKSIKLWEIMPTANLNNETSSQAQLSVGAGNQLLVGKRITDLEANLVGHTGPINAVKFSQQGDFFVTASDDKTLKVWSTKDGYLLTTLYGHTDRVTNLDIHPDNNTIVSSSFDNSLLVWEWQKRSPKIIYGQAAKMKGLSIRSRESKNYKVYLIAQDGELKTWARNEGNDQDKYPDSYVASDFTKTDGNDNQAVDQTGQGKPSLIALGVSPEQVSPEQQVVIAGDRKGKIYIWRDDQQKTQAQTNQPQEYAAHSEEIIAIAFSQDGTQFATASRDDTAKIWELVIEQGEGQSVIAARELYELKGHTDAVTSIAFSKNDEFIVTGSWDNSVKIWNRKGKLEHTFKDDDDHQNNQGHKGPVTSVAIHPDSTVIASGSSDNTVRLWDSQTFQHLKTLKDHTDSVYSIAFKPQPSKSDQEERIVLASVSGDRSIKLWNKDWELITTFRGHSDDVIDVAFSPDGEKLVSGSQDNMTFFWDVADIWSIDQLVSCAYEWANNYLQQYDDQDLPIDNPPKKENCPNPQTAAAEKER